MKRSTIVRAVMALFFAGAAASVVAQTSLSDLLKAQQAGTTQVTGTAQGAAAGVTNAVGSAFTMAGKGEGAAEVALPETGSRAVLAMATEDYPATPGDVYKLIYLKVTQPDTLNLIVEGDGSINAGFLGRFSAKGLSFRQIKAQIEKKVADSYPGSNPSLVIVSTGLFPVMVRGEVLRSGLSTAWGLSRLSEVISGFGTAYSSLRDVTVISKDGKTASYDLFAARRSGDLRQDPYLKPGDVVDVKRAERTVSLEGEVRRPGKYQLLPGEGLVELLSSYGDGTLESARTDLVVVTRLATAQKPDAESLVVDLAAGKAPALADGDVVKVPSRGDYLPVVYLEGAVVTEKTAAEKPAAATAETPDTYASIRIPFASGVLLSQILKPYTDKFSPNADLRGAYVAREGGRLSTDLEKLLFAHEASRDMNLKAGDRIVVPFGLNSAYVKGEVRSSGWIKTTASLRLSEALRALLSARSSIRDVRVTGSDGISSVYDLFKAEREGDLSQDPFVRPGDTIEVKRALRIVSLEGEVRRPGTYQLLAGEGAAELVALYGAGTLDTARTDLALLTKPATAESPEAASVVFDAAAKDAPALADGDAVRIPSRDEYLPVVYMEGLRLGGNAAAGTTAAPAAPAALPQANQPLGAAPAAADAKNVKTQDAAAATAATATAAEAYGTLRVPFRSGMLLSQALKSVAGMLPQDADLENAFVSRAGERIAVNLEKLLYSYDASLDLPLKADDRVLITRATARAYVTGEVAKSAWVDAGVSLRLSEALKGNVTSKSQIRRVTVKGRDGAETTYDLFLADRKGDLSQDPLLRPGDVVNVAKADRIVTLEGEVRRPGVYAPLPGEGMGDLVAVYGDGVLESAKPDLTVLTRKASAAKPESESLVFDLGGKALPELLDGDRIRVASRDEYLPVVYVEGAIQGEDVGVKKEAQQGNAIAVVSEQYRMLRVAFRQGELLSQALRGVRNQLDQRADLKRAFITRKGETKPLEVDLEKLLYRYDAADDFELKAEDRVVIPYGSMYVFVSGEVTKSSWVGMTGLTRLGEVVRPLVTPYSSLRSVTVVSEDGSEAVYDLFKAERAGDLSQDPYVRPGDIVRVAKAERSVMLEGEVHRPGKYQLLSGEGAGELVTSYGDGALESARTDLVLLTRKATKEMPEGETLVFDLKGTALPQLADGDRIRVASRDEYLPVVYLEGAITPDETEAAAKATAAGTGAATVPDPYGTLRVPFRKGQLVSQVARAQTARLSEKADLRRVYIARGEGRIAVDLERLLYAYDPSADLELMPGDRIVVPFGINDAYVKGEVVKAFHVEVTSATRLSGALERVLSPRSSVRDIAVSSLDGAKASYDLYRAWRFGEASQDPYLHPGDVVEVKQAARVVSLEGEVRKPGEYQPLSSEGLRELVDSYGDGALPSARLDLVVLTRKATAEKPEGESLIVDLGGSSLPSLQDGDRVRVPSRDEYLPVVYLEGAVLGGAAQAKAVPQPVSAPAGANAAASVQGGQTAAVNGTMSTTQRALLSSALGTTSNAVELQQGAGLPANQGADQGAGQKAAAAGTANETAAAEAYGIVRAPFREGLLASMIARANMEKLYDDADLRRAYIVRGAERISLDLEKLLFNYDRKNDVELKAGDHIVIPYGLSSAQVKGEVTKADSVQVTSATRLSEALKGNLTALSSIRDVSVTSLDGAVSTYDLFAAERSGDQTQNPYLRPGDVVEVKRLSRVVTVSGEVHRPGTYQILPGETLKDLVERYCDGLTEKANVSRMTIVRYMSDANPMGEKIILDYGANKDYSLNKYDVIRVPSYQDLLPVVWFEGAIGVVGEQQTAPQAAQRIPYTYFPGDTASEAALANRKLFSEVSDLSNAYVLRKGTERIKINLSQFLYGRDVSGDVPLEPNDVIVVPFRQFFVTVSGAVRLSGRYPYVPDRTWEYYIGLAGGFDTDKNTGQAIEIYDANAKKVAKAGRYIQPEDNIEAASNSFLYGFNKISGVLATSLSIVYVLLQVITLFK